MRILRAFGLVTMGLLIGVGLMFASGNASAQGNQRLQASPIEYPGGAVSLPFRFVKDTRTGGCYLVGLTINRTQPGQSEQVAAITPTDQAACFF